MPLEKTEGIILHSFPIRDYDQILVLYTRDRGLLSVVVKAARSKKRGLSSTVAPITRVEIVYKPGREDLHSCREISPLNYHLFLRDDINKLSAACELVKAVRTSQGVEKPSPPLYSLLRAFIERVEISSSLGALSTAFRLKILKHDGLLHFDSACSACQSALDEHYFFKGEPFCSIHCPPGGVRFQKGQFNTLSNLLDARQFASIESLQLPDDLVSDVKSLFEYIYL
jgi:DNA repair protein RecO (recombination protein O)